MHKTILWISTVTIAAGATFAVTRALDRHHDHAGQPALESLRKQQSQPWESVAADGENVEALRAELERLKRESATREATIASLVLAKVQAEGSGQGGLQAAPKDPSQEAARIFDERMNQNSPPSPEVLRIGASFRNLEREGLFKETQLTDLTCAGALCRAILSDQQSDRLEQTTRRLVEDAGKDVGSIVVLDRGAGQKLVYAATTSRDLTLPEDSAALAAQESE